MTPVKDLLAKETQVILRNTCARWRNNLNNHTDKDVEYMLYALDGLIKSAKL